MESELNVWGLPIESDIGVIGRGVLCVESEWWLSMGSTGKGYQVKHIEKAMMQEGRRRTIASMTLRRVLSLSTRRFAELYSASPLAFTRRKYCRYFPLRVYTLAGPLNKSAFVCGLCASNELPSTLEGPLCKALQTSFASAQKPSSGPSSCLRGTRTSAS